jgi:hypothetical protein
MKKAYISISQKNKAELQKVLRTDYENKDGLQLPKVESHR